MGKILCTAGREEEGGGGGEEEGGGATVAKALAQTKPPFPINLP